MTKKDRQKYNPLKSIYHLILGLQQVPESKMQKQANGKWQLMQKYLLEFYIELQQHFSTTILYYFLRI